MKNEYSMIEEYDILLIKHKDCEWIEVSPCVYCKEHNVRLYQGRLPIERDLNRQQREDSCYHEWNWLKHFGFYAECELCGAEKEGTQI